MTLISRIADRLILKPTTHRIETEDREQKWIENDDFKIEAWVLRTESKLAQPTKILMLKFPGAGGRAERARTYPAHLWTEAETEVWTINHRGYGQSTGPASIQNFSQTCDLVWAEAKKQFPQHKIFLYGNSLGCLSALYLSARQSPDAILLRNPPPLAQMIATRPKYTWWSFGFSKRVAKQVPVQLDTVENARASNCPALFVMSEKDQVIPPKYQKQIIESYRGQTRLFVIDGADHHHRIPAEQESQYTEDIQWLWENSLK